MFLLYYYFTRPIIIKVSLFIKSRKHETQNSRNNFLLIINTSVTANPISAIFQVCSKIFLLVEKDYTNKLSKFQVHKGCESRDIHIWKHVIFGGKICYFYIPKILGASDAVCIWLLIGQSQSVFVIVKRN